MGVQRLRHLPDASYTDASLTLGKDLGSGWSLGAALVATDADKAIYVPGAAANSTRFLGRTGPVLNVKATF